MGNNNSNNKSPLRKSQSVPDTQKLSPDAPVLFNKEKSASQQRLNHSHAKPGKPSKTAGKKQKHPPDDLPLLPQTEAVFLPEFPLRGDLEELDFEVIDVIAKGAFGNVIKVQREDQKRFYAMKVLDKEQILQEGAIRQCKDEAAIQSMAGEHPFIVKAHEYWQSRRFLYIVLDYVPHGDMFTLWTFHGAFPEDLVRLYIAEISMVIDYLHNASVIYRDVKMENILFDPKGHIQLTDFGLAKWLHGGEQTRTVCGTLQYMAPEVLAVYPYGHSADWWSVGILMYAMLAGKYPVDGADTHTNMAQKVFESDYLLPSNISDSAQDVINRFLTKSPHKRLSNLDVIQDLHFFQDLYFSDLIDGKINPITVVPEDFFPMTGESWAPHVVTQEEQSHFDEFDYDHEADRRVSYAAHPLRHHADQYRPPSIAAAPGDREEPYRKRSYSQPMQVLYSENRKGSLSNHQQEAAKPADPYRYQDQPYTQKSGAQHDHSDPHRKLSTSSQPYGQQLLMQSSQSYTRQQSEVRQLPESALGHQASNHQKAQNLTGAGAYPSPLNGNSIDSRSLHSSNSNSADLPGYSRSGSISDSDRGGNFGGTGAPAAQVGTGPSVVSNSSMYRRSNSGDGLVSTNHPSHYSPVSFTNNNPLNGYGTGNYKTLEPPPTVSLKLPGPASVYNQQGQRFSQQDQTAQQQVSQFITNLQGPTMQAMNSLLAPTMQNSQSSIIGNRSSSSSQAYVTVDSPLINLPASNNPNLHNLNTNNFSTQSNPNLYNQDLNKYSIQNNTNPYNQDFNTTSAQKNSNLLGLNVNKLQPPAKSSNQDLRNQPQIGVKTNSYGNSTSLPFSNKENRQQDSGLRRPLNQQFSLTQQVPPKPQKPAVPQKPSVPAKPSAMVKPQSVGVKPQPAPRKSLRGQPGSPGSTASQAVNMPSSQGFGQSGALGGSLTPNYSSSLPPASAVFGSMATPVNYLSASPSPDPVSTFSESPGLNVKSPNMEMDSFKWNLPADTTPTYL